MQATPAEILRRSTMSIFKCHFIMIAVSFLLMFFLSSAPWFVTAFYVFIAVSYVFLLYSESVMAARRDFYNANGVREKLDYNFGFKIGFYAHILSLIILVFEVIFYLICYFSGHLSTFVEWPLYVWMFHFIGLFPDMGTANVWIVFAEFFGLCFFPCLVCGISYRMGLWQCKTKGDVEKSGYKNKKTPTNDEKHLL